jgi:hypothetical protein
MRMMDYDVDLAQLDVIQENAKNYLNSLYLL